MKPGPEAVISVLVVEDARARRDGLVRLLEADPALQVVGSVDSGKAALAFLDMCRPDVILMDMRLPDGDGLEATRRIMWTNPVPIVVCAAGTHPDQVQTAMRALEAGALAVLERPGPGAADTEADAVVQTLKTMSEVRLVRRWQRTAEAGPLPAVNGPASREALGADVAIVAVGASTGGPPALLRILAGLPAGFPAPILVVQHVATGFTAGFVEWLADNAGRPVQLARDGEVPLPGHVYVAPDDLHLRVGAQGGLLTTRGEPHNGLRPSVGVLFRSVADRFGRRAVGVLLTGMGRDGAEELKYMAERGALTIAQDEESCAVFGMPGEAVRLGAARLVAPPERIVEILRNAVHSKADRGGNHA